VFVASAAGHTQSLWLRSLTSFTAHPLPGAADAQQPFWSPDSRSIEFFARGKLVKIEVAGGPAPILADAPFPLGGTWSAEGAIVFVARPRGPLLFGVLAGGGDARPITHMEGAGYCMFPSFLPYGQHFLFLSLNTQSGDSGVYAASLDLPEAKLILRGDQSAANAGPGYLLFARGTALMAQPFDTTHLSLTGEAFPISERVDLTRVFKQGELTVSKAGTLVYRSSASTRTHLVWLDRAGRTVDEPAPPGDYFDPELSPDGKRVVYWSGPQGGVEVWLMELERHITTRLTVHANVPIWSRMGRPLRLPGFPAA
jgi:hypothetical protein